MLLRNKSLLQTSYSSTASDLGKCQRGLEIRSLSGEWLLSVSVKLLCRHFYLVFPFYRDEGESWQTSTGRKVKVGLRGFDVPSISTLLSYRAQRSHGVRSWDSIRGGINQKSVWLAKILFTCSPAGGLEESQLPGRDGTESSPVAMLSRRVHRAAANARATSY